MIDIYTEKIDSKDWIIKNDLFFNLNTSNEEMSDISYRLYMDLPACPQYVSDLHNENIQHTILC